MSFEKLNFCIAISNYIGSYPIAGSCKPIKFIRHTKSNSFRWFARRHWRSIVCRFSLYVFIDSRYSLWHADCAWIGYVYTIFSRSDAHHLLRFSFIFIHLFLHRVRLAFTYTQCTQWKSNSQNRIKISTPSLIDAPLNIVDAYLKRHKIQLNRNCETELKFLQLIFSLALAHRLINASSEECIVYGFVVYSLSNVVLLVRWLSLNKFFSSSSSRSFTDG